MSDSKQKIVFSKEIDDNHNGQAIGLSFLAIGLVLQFLPGYFGSEWVTNAVKFVFIVIGAFDKAIMNLTDKPTATIGETVSDCLFFVFGGISQVAAKRRIRYEVDLNCFKEELQAKIDNIPKENRMELNVQVICSALDHMRYCLKEKELRELFSSLIANLINAKNVVWYIHHMAL